MDELVKYIINEFGYLIKEDKKGNKYVYDFEIDKLSFSIEEKQVIKKVFIMNGIKIKKNKEKSYSLVKNLQYGDSESYGYSKYDKTRLAQVDYSDEQIIYEDYKDLDEYILNVFIPSKVYIKVNKSKNVKEDLEKDSYLSIQLRDILALNLSDKEIEHVIELLRENDIRVGGKSQDLEDVSIKYDYINTYQRINEYEEPYEKDELRSKLQSYYNNGNIMIGSSLEKEIISKNLRLVSYVAYAIAYRNKIPTEEILSYGYEGLFYALRHYNPNKNNYFSTYAIPCIKGFIIRNLAKENNVSRRFFEGFSAVRYEVEKDYDRVFQGDKEMLDDIINKMISRGSICKNFSSSNYDALLKKESIQGLIASDRDLYFDYDVESTYLNSLQEKFDIKNLFCVLNDQEKKVIIARFGFDGSGFKTYRQVGEIYSLSCERIRTIISTSLKKIRCYIKTYNLKDEFFFESSHSIFEEAVLIDYKKNNSLRR